MFESFTHPGRRVLVLAQDEARALDHSYIGTEHILLGLIHGGDSIAAKTLESLGVLLGGVASDLCRWASCDPAPPSRGAWRYGDGGGVQSEAHCPESQPVANANS